jgi:molybdopterin-guanine dinucleotide biosynthesis protein MobB
VIKSSRCIFPIVGDGRNALAAESPLPPVVCFVGPKNSGKTTLLEGVIRELSAQGVRVAAVKHDAHRFEIDHPGKDSHRLFHAGAESVLLSSAGKTAFVERNREEPSLPALVGRFAGAADLVLAEGYKSSPYPKVLLHRRDTGQAPLPVPAALLLAVVSDEPLALGAPLFHPDDAAAVARLVREKAMPR